MKILTVVPTKLELKAILKACQEQGYRAKATVTDGLKTSYFPDLETTIALGGLGKKRLALQTQRLIDAGEPDLVICAGAAGALAADLAPGDVVIATETVEYDLRNKSGSPILSCYPGSEPILRLCRQELRTEPAFQVDYGPVASGEEFLMTHRQRAAVYRRTNALVAAMEGAGGAQVCKQNDVAFLEIRAVTDQGNILAVFDFLLNLRFTMKNLAQVVVALAKLGTI